MSIIEVKPRSSIRGFHAMNSLYTMPIVTCYRMTRNARPTESEDRYMAMKIEISSLQTAERSPESQHPSYYRQGT